MKRFLKKFTALVLSIALILPMCVGLFPRAQAAAAVPGDGGDFADQSLTGRPNLYVDFLGDNAGYNTGGTTSPGTLLDPEFKHFALQTDPPDPRNQGTWPGYDAAHTGYGSTIFWIGVGVDQRNALTLLRPEEGGAEGGLYSAELGFYYNSKFIEPYIDPAAGSFMATMQAVNIDRYSNMWGASFEVIDARTGLMPQTEEITAEIIGNYAGYPNHATAPNVGMSMIMGDDPDAEDPNPWRMTYISVERREEAGPEDNRFSGAYDSENPDDDTEYLILIPFVLKQFDSDMRLCLRMARNATHFSIGGGAEGAEVYGAWERVTVRNPGHSLKLMAGFTGDLNIFTGRKVKDNLYTASLEAELAGNGANAATLRVTDDPSPTPISAWVGTIGTTLYGSRTIDGLAGGIGMTLDVACATGFKVTVEVVHTGLMPEVEVHTITVTAKERYTFIMPEYDVTVRVIFELDGATDFYSTLVEDRSQEIVIPGDEPGRIPGNYAKITDATDGGNTIDSDSVPPAIILPSDTKPRLQIDLHPDYEAEVFIHTLSPVPVADVTVNDETGVAPPPSGVSVDADGKLLISESVVLTFTTQRKDIVVEILYRPAETRTATLAVYHTAPREYPAGSGLYPDLARNVAQLSFPAYATHPSVQPTQVYSGVVYDKDYGAGLGIEDNSAVEFGIPRVLTPVSLAAASRSMALGGDGALMPQVWDDDPAGAFMTGIFDPGTVAIGDLPAITAFDLKNWGMRRDAAGNYFTTNAEVNDFRTRLLALRDLAAAGQAALTLAQMQVFLVDDANHAAEPGTYPAAVWKDGATAAAEWATLLAGWPETGRRMEATPWPTGEGAPRPSGASAATLSARPGRGMTLTLAATSYYTVSEIRLIDGAGIAADVVVYPATTGGAEANRDAQNRNVYHFDMPDYDCTVRVTYAPRGLNAVRLVTTGMAGTGTGNSASVTVHVPQDSTGTQYGLPSAVRRETNTGNGTSIISEALVGGTVSATVTVAPGYTATVQVFQTPSGSAITPTPTPGTLVGGTAGTTATFTFPVPAGEDVQVSVLYQPPASDPKTATLRWSTRAGSATNPNNRAVWMQESGGVWMPLPLPGGIMKTEPPDAAMRAQISVAPGYYIHSINVISNGASYPYTLSDNGYNGGLGGTARLDMRMPPEDTVVYIVYQAGPPPVEPEYAMRVVVDDPDSTAAPFATVDLSVTGGNPGTPSGPLDKTTAAPGDPWVAYVGAGKEVVLTFTAPGGYHVAGVTVTPAGLGVTPEWSSPTQMRFTAPAGDSVVTVHIAAGATQLHYLNVRATQTGDTPDLTVNAIRTVHSDTLHDYIASGFPVTNPMSPTAWERIPGAGQAGAAKAGEPVWLDLTVKAGWYLDSVVVWSDGGSVPVSLPADGGWNGGAGAPSGSPVVASFRMPAGETWVVANYRLGPPPSAPKEYAVNLLITDPDNMTDGTPEWLPADNYAHAEMTGTVTGRIPASTIPPGDELGRARPPWVSGAGTEPIYDVGFAAFGDEVMIHYAADDGFFLEIIVLTPSGLNIVPTYLAGNRAKFTMPDAPVTVDVRFRKGEAAQYRADLILRPPAGTAMASAGKGSFTSQGTLDAPVYSYAPTAGERVSFDLFAADGYYISRVEVTPASLGVPVVYTGHFGRQSGYFIMPPANVYINVFYEKAWPDEARYGLTLQVSDPKRDTAPTVLNSSYARLDTAGGAAIPGAADVFGSQSQSLSAVTADRDEVFVRIVPLAGRYLEQVTVTTAKGEAVDWRYAVGESAPGSGVFYSGIAFLVPAADVTVAVRFGDTAPPTFRINGTVHGAISGDGTVTVTEHSGAGTPAPSFVLDDAVPGGMVDGVAAGTRVSVVITPPPTGRAVLAVWAVETATGRQLLFPAAQVEKGGSVRFVMPEGDVELHVVYGPGPAAGEYPATLTVSGPAGSGGAVMEDASSSAVTGAVPAGASASLFAVQGAALTVTVTPAPGFHIERVEVRDFYGNLVSHTWQSVRYTGGPPAVWSDNPDKQFTFTMPPFAGHVLVVLAEDSADDDFTAQLVVNDSAFTGTPPSGNTARLVRDPAGAGDTDTVLSGLGAGDRVYLDVTLAPGYKIESILVVSARHGITLPLPLGAAADQRTAFDMPADDVVVYIKFVPDGMLRYNARLEVVNSPYNAGNRAAIHSPYSGMKGPISTGTELVQAAANTEWVTVEYESVAGTYAEVTVEDGEGNPIPFTQVTMLIPGTQAGKITLPMVTRPITVKVTYVAAEPVYPLTLHVIDLTSGGAAAASWAQLDWTAGPLATAQTYALPAPGGSAILDVPAGAAVTLNAEAAAGNYIHAAYVLYQAGGQMIKLNLPPNGPGDTPPDTGFSGAKSDTFVMHPGACDVYVYFTDAEPAATERAVALMVTGPVEADRVSFGQMWRGAYDADSAVTVFSNEAHGYLTAQAGEMITVQMTVKAGLAIDSILLTPLGIAVTPTRSGNTYTFTMPAENMAVRITLRESSASDFTATLHLGMWPSGTLVSGDRGQISCILPDGSTIMARADGESITIPASSTVDLKVGLNSAHLILSAYVLQGSVLVPLSANLEGTLPGASLLDPLAFDGDATFTMPAGNVNVYLWYTGTPPSPDPWYTAVLTVTDANSAGVQNLGQNAAGITGGTPGLGAATQWARSTGTPGHKFITVSGGETVSVEVFLPPEQGYVFSSAGITTAPASTATLAGGPPAPFTFTIPAQPAPGHNAAVAIHFGSATVTASDLDVVAEDGDNPGDGTVTNRVEVTPSGISKLTLLSTAPAGAWQVIRNVPQNTPVAIAVTPEAGYYPVALLEAGGAATVLPLSPSTAAQPPDGNTVYTGSAVMPGSPATLRVVFFKGYAATLTLEEGIIDGSYADMTENTFGGALHTDAYLTSDRFHALPSGTGLETIPTPGVNSRLLGVLATTESGTRILSPSEGGYGYALAREDVEVRVVTAPAAGTSFIAAARLVNAPLGAGASIRNDTVAYPAHAIWVEAGSGDEIELTVTVPAGYRADITNDAGVTLSSATLPADGVATFPMPAQDVNITITFVKTAMTATLVAVDAADTDAAALNALTVSAGSPGPVTQSGLALGAVMTYGATAGAGREVAAILLTVGGSTTPLSPAVGIFAMPDDDVTVTVIFRETAADKPYIAAVETAGTGGLPGNAALAISNQTTALPAGVNWAQGYENDALRFTFTTEPGYHAVVTAVQAGTAIAVPLVQQGTTGTGTVYLTMPAADVTITVTYLTAPPDTKYDLTLTLVGAGGQAGNRAALTFPGGTLSVAGSADPASVSRTAAAAQGDVLRVSADWTAEYAIDRITLTAHGVEQELPVNRYGANAAALPVMPGADATVTVYYTRVYRATLHIVGASGGDDARMEEPVSAQSVHSDNTALTGLAGGETITVTAAADSGRRVVGVLLTTAAGVQSIPVTALPEYAFAMPEEDVTVTVIFEAEPGEAYIAMIQFDPASEGQTEPGNGVRIENSTDPSAPASPPYWAAGVTEDVMTVTFRVAPGYQARVTAADEDGNPVYISRTTILPTTMADAEATLTMPGGVNVIVTVRFVKGYTAALELADYTGAAHKATLADDLVAVSTLVAAESAAGTTGALGAVTYTETTTPPGTPAAGDGRIPALPNGTTLTADADPGGMLTPDETFRILRATPFGGTAVDMTPTAGTSAAFSMPSEDSAVTVLLRDKDDPNDLLATVALGGESGISGNRAVEIFDLADPVTTFRGDYWTTTREAHMVAVTFTVAKGYTAEVTVRDSAGTPIPALLYTDAAATLPQSAGSDALYVPFAPNGTYIGDPITVYLRMPSRDVTVVLRYSFAGQYRAPYDPEREAISEASPKREVQKGHIYGENHRAYAIITIPTLIDDDGALYSVEPDDLFRFYVFNGAEYLELVEGVDVRIEPADPDNLAAGYDYGTYYTDTGAVPAVPYTGARFRLIPLFAAAAEDDSTQAKAYQRMLDNGGSLDADSGKTALFVAAERLAQRSAYTEVLIRPSYGITGRVISYAPQHIMYLDLYEFDAAIPGADPMNPAHYKTTPSFTQDRTGARGTGLWDIAFGVYSPDLIGDPSEPGYTAPIYKLVVAKPGHIPYTRVNLSTDTGQSAYDGGKQTFAIADSIILIPGDLDWKRGVNSVDLKYLTDYISGNTPWSSDLLPTDPDWASSVYNPSSRAYWADLDGSRRVDMVDYVTLMRYYSLSEVSYQWIDPTAPDFASILPFGYADPSALPVPLALVTPLDPATAAPLAPVMLPMNVAEPEADDTAFPSEDDDTASLPEETSDDDATPPPDGGDTPPPPDEPAAPPPPDEDDAALPPDDETEPDLRDFPELED